MARRAQITTVAGTDGVAGVAGMAAVVGMAGIGNCVGAPVTLGAVVVQAGLGVPQAPQNRAASLSTFPQ
jgi:hypothetical protein